MGITCTAEKTVKGNIIEYMNYPEYIFPVGRLDKPSQGLIILTNDGVLANKILESENEHEKEYIVTLGNLMKNLLKVCPVELKYVDKSLDHVRCLEWTIILLKLFSLKD